MQQRTEQALEACWKAIAERYPNHELLVAGAPTFVCMKGSCPVHCCFRFTVSLDEAEVEGLSASSGLRPADFLECEAGEPIALPLLQPYILARVDGRCRLLGPDFLCTQYEGRPRGCRSYPHQVLFVDRKSRRPVHGDLVAMRESIEAIAAGQDPPLAPLLLRHAGCPGFTGPALDWGGWADLLVQTARLQYSLEGA